MHRLLNTRSASWLALLSILCSVYAQTVAVRWNELRQPIDGFGASDAWFADDIILHPDKTEMLDLLFKRDGGAGLSILRHRVQAQERQWTDYTMELGSGDLDFGRKPWIGVRFTGVAIPQGAVIDSAYVQFTADASHSRTCQVTIRGEGTWFPRGSGQSVTTASLLGLDGGVSARREPR